MLLFRRFFDQTAAEGDVQRGLLAAAGMGFLNLTRVIIGQVAGRQNSAHQKRDHLLDFAVFAVIGLSGEVRAPLKQHIVRGFGLSRRVNDDRIAALLLRHLHAGHVG